MCKPRLKMSGAAGHQHLSLQQDALGRTHATQHKGLFINGKHLCCISTWTHSFHPQAFLNSTTYRQILTVGICFNINTASEYRKFCFICLIFLQYPPLMENVEKKVSNKLFNLLPFFNSQIKILD